MLIERLDVPIGVMRDGKWTQDGTRTILAVCDDLWALHPNGVDDDTSEPVFRLTHRPTGYALIGEASWEYALELLREIRRRDIDWTFTNPEGAKALSKEWADIQATAKRNIGGIWLADTDGPRAGFDCPDCGHQHQNERFGFICIGCPCPRTALDSSPAIDAVDPHVTK